MEHREFSDGIEDLFAFFLLCRHGGRNLEDGRVGSIAQEKRPSHRGGGLMSAIHDLEQPIIRLGTTIGALSVVQCHLETELGEDDL